MTTHALIPTEHELGILTADKPLLAILRPMEPQPEWEEEPGLSNDGIWRGRYRYLVHDGSDQGLEMMDWFEAKPPFATGRLIAWQEEWWQDKHGGQFLDLTRQLDDMPAIRKTWGHVKQPAATMPETIARFRNTVAECWPVKLDDLISEETVKLGFVATLCLDWTSNYPDHPFASSWAWWIGLDPKGNR